MTSNPSPEIVQAICTAHGLGKIESLVQPVQGNINRCLVVNDAYVLRFDVLDWGGANRYAGEKWAYEILSQSDVPVSQVIALDTSKSLVPYDYLILTKMPGQTISTSTADLPFASRYSIGYSAGQHLATIHSHDFAQFGLLYNILAGTPQPDWPSYVADHFRYYRGQVQALGLLSVGILGRIDALIVRMQPLLASVQRGVFIHGDYHFLNLLQQDGRLSAVLDFDWASSGDPSWDFRIDDQIESEVPGSKEAFYAGYTSRLALPDGHWERVSFYRIGLYLDFLEGAAKDDNEIELLIPQLLREMDWLEAHL
ncbi:MAG: phosphotransferase [Anaerolineaceae bacterium]|nr:phosphotransferase [Anaerolineaceae bacterium]